ncbi:winged helix-turn-helix domain-containing protein [Variovorax sp. J22P240]|uniref:ATP-binding protein n=1 Tax=Variovorax sp. J22P240 TaxID=3053514 RepID=UPI002575F357|nr:winged helix-turn-helix domain-containing protein [Variovorax sp. J22P240]MDM0001017.1 winged helix-turn-helix domain-containing protein [Variovorax sp. J22P240]
MLLDCIGKADAMTTPTMDHADKEDWIAAFGPFRLSAAERLLDRDGVPVRLGGRALSLLIALVAAAGQVIDKRKLMARAWPDVVVDEGSLRVHMVALRKALGDAASDARYVTNVAGQGYCFVAPVSYVSRNQLLGQAPARPEPAAGLPASAARVVGRDDTIRAIQAELRQKRFVTVVGPGGIGKTTVAVSTAHAMFPIFDDGACFIDLCTVNDATLVPGTLAATLGLVGHLGDAPSGIVNFLRDKHMLLVLDSCEHLIGAVAALADRIYMEAPRVHILATSRESLRVEGERVHLLPPLACPPAGDSLGAEEALAYPAVQLFVQRAGVNAGRFRLGDADAPAVARICRELDGIALAIELAAGRLDAYGVEGIAALLNKSIAVLWHGRRTAVPRHQTMSAALEWSYNLLTEIERTVLRRLSAFVGNFSLEAAQFVAGEPGTDDAEVVEAVANLVAKSLLTNEARGKGMCYRLLDSTRVYALQRLIECGESTAVASRHASWFRGAVERRALPIFATEAERTPLQPTELLGNVRAALDWSLSDAGDMEVGTALAAAAAPLFLEMSLLTECRGWMEKAIASLPESARGTRREMELQASLGQSLMFTRGNSEEVRCAFSHGLEIAKELQDYAYQLRLLAGLGTCLLRMGDFRGSLEAARHADVVAGAMRDPVASGTVDSMLGVALDLSGQIADAEVHWEAALKGSSEGNRIRTARLGFDHRVHALSGQARCHWLRGRCDQAAVLAQHAIEQAESLDHPVTLCIALIWAGSVFLWRGDWSREERIAERLHAHATKHSLSPYAAVAMGLRGEVAVRHARPELGVGLLSESLRAVRADRYDMRTGVFIIALAEGLTKMGKHSEAMAAIEEAISLIERHGGYSNMPEALRVKGEILASAPAADLQSAEQCLLDAIDFARRQGALSWELRASNSLAGLWLRQRRVEPARRLLAPIHGRFSEGHRTVDLITARDLLTTLGSPLTS